MNYKNKKSHFIEKSLFVIFKVLNLNRPENHYGRLELSLPLKNGKIGEIIRYTLSSTISRKKEKIKD